MNKKSVITGLVLSASTLGVLKVANVAQEFQEVPSVAAESARARAQTTPAAPSKNTTVSSVSAVAQPNSEKTTVASTEEPVATVAATYLGAPVLQDALAERVAEHAVLPASDSVEDVVASSSENVTEEASQERVEKPVDESTVRDSASVSDKVSEQATDVVREDSQAIASERAVAEPIKEETPTVQAEEAAPVEHKTDVQEESVEQHVSEDLAPITESQVETVASIEEPKAEPVVETLTSEPVAAPEVKAEVAQASAVQHVNYDGTTNTYPYGQCTWGVKAVAPWAGTQWGNGADWARSAARDGFRTGSNPEVGAIVSWDDGGYGHVAYVTHVDLATGYVKVVEANYAGDQSLGDHRGWFNPSDGSWGAVTYIYNN